MTGKELNKRIIENFIKSGAFDCLDGTRKQMMMIYIQVMDTVNREKKESMTGQMSLFDFMGEEEKKEYEIKMPPVGEYSKESRLAFEKEVLGVYISGHPLEEYEEQWRRGSAQSHWIFSRMRRRDSPGSGMERKSLWAE